MKIVSYLLNCWTEDSLMDRFCMRIWNLYVSIVERK
jgi:hypothetical protein